MNMVLGQMDELGNTMMKNRVLKQQEQERNDLIAHAIELAKADKKLTPEENIFINELFNEWTETSIE